MSSSQNVRRENPSAPGVVSLPEPAVGSGTTPASTTAPPRQQHKPGNKLAKKKKTPKAPISEGIDATSTRVPAKKSGRTEEEKRAKRLLKRMQKTEKKDSRVQLVFTAAHSTVAILKNHGISCAMFGSLACNLYGEFRNPKDVDMLVLHPPADSKVPLYSDEDLKKLIADADPDHYYLKLPRNPEAPYRILYYHDKSLDCKTI